MNRLTPLIRRPVAAAIPMAEAPPALTEATLLDDLRFFALAWAGGMIFFGTLFA